MRGNNTITPAQLRRLFGKCKHYGESARLARQLRVNRATVSRWCKGEVASARIEAAAIRRVRQLAR